MVGDRGLEPLTSRNSTDLDLSDSFLVQLGNNQSQNDSPDVERLISGLTFSELLVLI